MTPNQKETGKPLTYIKSKTIDTLVKAFVHHLPSEVAKVNFCSAMKSLDDEFTAEIAKTLLERGEKKKLKKSLELLGSTNKIADDHRKYLESSITALQLQVGRLRKELSVNALGEALSDAWRMYKATFGEEPHGTEPQMKALLELAGLSRKLIQPPPDISKLESVRSVLNRISKKWADFLHLDDGKIVPVIEGFKTIEEAQKICPRKKLGSSRKG